MEMCYFKVVYQVCGSEKFGRYFGATSLWRLVLSLNDYELFNVVEIKRVNRLPKNCEVFKVFA